mmetsp:Transcript_59161/g.137759  ORF Transcript_59161/g.137759 Transcript_59161/m.137759 type:complete len:84 (-) Transcript_59161:170-421(-)
MADQIILSCRGLLERARVVPAASSTTLGLDVPHFLQVSFLANCMSLHSGFGQIQSPAFMVCLLVLKIGFEAPHRRHTSFLLNW